MTPVAEGWQSPTWIPALFHSFLYLLEDLPHLGRPWLGRSVPLWNIYGRNIAVCNQTTLICTVVLRGHFKAEFQRRAPYFLNPHVCACLLAKPQHACVVHMMLDSGSVRKVFG